MKELNIFRKFLNEGTWSYGSENDMMKALEEMNAMLMHSDPRQLKAGLDAMDNALYRIFGDDDFHDNLGFAKDFAAEGDLDRAKNALSDAIGIGDRMIAKIHGMSGDLEENSRMEFEITPEYLFDAAMQYIQDDYDGASLHVAPDGTTDDFYDGDKHVHTIKSKEQAEDIIDNFETQMVRTAQQDFTDEQDAMYGKANFVEEELEENDKTLDEIIGEEKESLTKQIMRKYPKKYKDEKAVKDAAKELMKNPKYKAKQGIGPVLQALLKGK